MLRKDLFAVYVVTVYLAIFCILLQFDSTLEIALMLFSLSPFFIGWMVFSVLIRGKYNGPALGTKEYGYQDKQQSQKTHRSIDSA